MDLFLGGRKTCRAIKFTALHADSLKLRGVGKARFMTIQTFEGPFLSAVTPRSYEYIHATEFLKVIRSIKDGDLLPEFIPDPVGAGVNPRTLKKVHPRTHIAAFNEDDDEEDAASQPRRRKLAHPGYKEPLEMTVFTPSDIASVGGHAAIERRWLSFEGNFTEFSVSVYRLIKAKSEADEATARANEATARAKEAMARVEEVEQRRLDIKTAAEEAKSSADEAKSKAMLEALREQAGEPMAMQLQLDIKTAADVQRPAETVRILLNVQKCRASHCCKDSVDGDFCTFHRWN